MRGRATRARKGPTVLVVGTWIEELIDGIHCSWRLDDGRGPLIGRRRRPPPPVAIHWPPSHVPHSLATSPGARPSLSLSPTASTFPSAPWMPSCGPRLSPSTTPTDSQCPRKALKVVDLKEILNRAGVSIPSKSNKNDLIARILASPAALDVYHAQHSPKPSKTTPEKPAVQQEQPSQVSVRTSLSRITDAMLTFHTVVFYEAIIKVSCSRLHTVSYLRHTSTAAPTATQSPQELPAATSPSVKPVSSIAPAVSTRVPLSYRCTLMTESPKSLAATTITTTEGASTAPTTSNSRSTEDEELERRKARAARFGLPLVEPAKPTADAANTSKPTKLAAAAPDVSLAQRLSLWHADVCRRTRTSLLRVLHGSV